MTFREYADVLAKELGVEIEVEGDACAVSLGSEEGDKVEILLQGIGEHGALLTCAELGEPPPEGRKRLYQTILEANDLFSGTAGATLSLNPQNGHVRLQRYDDIDTLARIGLAKALIAFSDTAAAWKRLITDFRDSGNAGESDSAFGGFSAMQV